MDLPNLNESEDQIKRNLMNILVSIAFCSCRVQLDHALSTNGSSFDLQQAKNNGVSTHEPSPGPYNVRFSKLTSLILAVFNRDDHPSKTLMENVIVLWKHLISKVPPNVLQATYANNELAM